MHVELPNVFHGISTDSRDGSKIYCRVALHPVDCGSGWQVTIRVTAQNGDVQSKTVFPAPAAYEAAVTRYVEAERVRRSLGFRPDTALARHVFPAIALHPLSDADPDEALAVTDDHWVAHAISGTRVLAEAMPKMGSRLPTLRATTADGQVVSCPAQLVNALMIIVLSIPSLSNGMLALDGFLADDDAFQAIDVLSVNSISTANLPLRTRLDILASLSHFTNDLCRFMPVAHSHNCTSQRVLYRHLDSRYMHKEDAPWALLSADAQCRHILRRLAASMPRTRLALAL